jgi:signal transduction histidine kinase/ActR/RegA family two-component response regulator
MFQVQEHRSRAQIDVEAAHSELELALATLAVRMASMATAIERESMADPEAFRSAYANVTRSPGRAMERAVALMIEFATPDQVDAFVDGLTEQFQRTGYPPFDIFPGDQAEALFPALFVEPPTSRPRVFGYNMGSSPARLSAARDALHRGVMTTSSPVSLSQDTDLSQASFLMLYPVYLRSPAQLGGARHAVLGAGMTPTALFNDHMNLFDRQILEIEIGIAGVTLPVTLGDESVRGPRIPILRDFALPSIATNGEGFEVPFSATAYYVPKASDGLLPLFAALVTALVLGLVAKSLFAREEATRNLEAALARNEAQLREAYRIQARSQRVEALGRLVGGVAHDFNNILSVILGNLELMKEERAISADDPYVTEAITATHRGAHLTRQLLTVGRKSRLQPRPVTVADALHDSVRMLQRVLPESLQITTIPAAGLWPILVDPDGLQNAVLNLALNARDAMDGRGKLIIEASNTRASQDYLDDRPDEEIAPGRYVMISVTDNGPGMTPEIMDRAFEPFFTTKQATDGSGLGLPSVLGFCRQSGGTCRIYSEPGVGATIKMYFPVSDSAQSDPAVVDIAMTSEAGHGRILLAEDEDSVARVIVRQLETAGYTVKRVPTGDAAWSELESGAPYDLLISDLVMPGSLQGAELARRVEAARPGMSLLLISGYPQEAAIEGNGVASRHPVLTKPVAKAELLRVIKRVIDQ